MAKTIPTITATTQPSSTNTVNLPLRRIIDKIDLRKIDIYRRAAILRRQVIPDRRINSNRKVEESPE